MPPGWRKPYGSFAVSRNGTATSRVEEKKRSAVNGDAMVVMSGAAVLALHVTYPDARLVSKVESRIRNHGEIWVNLYLRAPDEKGRWAIRTASYVVLTWNPRALKITLTQLRNHDNILISF